MIRQASPLRLTGWKNYMYSCTWECLRLFPQHLHHLWLSVPLSTSIPMTAMSSVTADPQFLSHWNLLITCIGTECEDLLSKYVHFKVPNKSCKFQKVYRLPDLLKMGFQMSALLVRALRPVLGATAVIKYLDNQQAFANKPLI